MNIQLDLFEITNFAINWLVLNNLFRVGIVSFNLIFCEGFYYLHYFLTIEITFWNQTIIFSRIFKNIF